MDSILPADPLEPQSVAEPPAMATSDDWKPACAISPCEGAPVEFESKSTGRVHRGRFVGACYVDAVENLDYPSKMVRRWRSIT